MKRTIDRCCEASEADRKANCQAESIEISDDERHHRAARTEGGYVEGVGAVSRRTNQLSLEDFRKRNRAESEVSDPGGSGRSEGRAAKKALPNEQSDRRCGTIRVACSADFERQAKHDRKLSEDGFAAATETGDGTAYGRAGQQAVSGADSSSFGLYRKAATPYPSAPSAPSCAWPSQRMRRHSCASTPGTPRTWRRLRPAARKDS